VLISLTLAGSVAPGALTGANVTKVPALNQLPGAALVGDAGCTTCHFFGAIGANGPGANLSSGSPKFGTDQAAIQAWVGGGAAAAGTGMPDFSKTLTKQQIAEIAQLVASLKTGTVQPLAGGG
jgi:mono/diheme cytochrome c family protein